MCATRRSWTAGVCTGTGCETQGGRGVSTLKGFQAMGGQGLERQPPGTGGSRRGCGSAAGASAPGEVKRRCVRGHGAAGRVCSAGVHLGKHSFLSCRCHGLCCRGFLCYRRQNGR